MKQKQAILAQVLNIGPQKKELIEIREEESERESSANKTAAFGMKNNGTMGSSIHNIKDDFNSSINDRDEEDENEGES